MKRIISVLAIMLALTVMLNLSACGEKNKENSSGDMNSSTATYKDGEYKASAAKFDSQGYKPYVNITVRDGKIYSIDCDAEHSDGGTKKDHSESGRYNMKEGGAQYEWHEEIAIFEQYVTENGFENVILDTSGKTDAITGCTIAVSEYVELMKKALKKAKG